MITYIRKKFNKALAYFTKNDNITKIADDNTMTKEVAFPKALPRECAPWLEAHCFAGFVKFPFEWRG